MAYATINPKTKSLFLSLCLFFKLKRNLMNNNNYCVIMAGGIGSRFWPMSRTSRPKQFIDILGTGKTLIQQTFDRFLTICPKENIYIVTNELYKEQILDQLNGITESQVLCEPLRRNTAPAIVYAAFKIMAINPEARLVVAPSDHIILKEDSFTDVVLSALKASADNDWLLTLGIKPSRPDTGYGYIQYCDTHPYIDDQRLRKVKTFTEKPNLELAQTFLESGDFLWNSGIFIWSLKSIMAAFDSYLSEVSNLFREGWIISIRSRKLNSSIKFIRSVKTYPSTMELWRRPKMCMSLKRILAGQTSVPGDRCSIFASKMKMKMP
jgi:mannose-1-phosphate guanylyltransferase